MYSLIITYKCVSRISFAALLNYELVKLTFELVSVLETALLPFLESVFYDLCFVSNLYTEELLVNNNLILRVNPNHH